MASRLVVEAFRRLPRTVQMFLVRRTTPKYTLGVQVIVRRPDGQILLVRQPYRQKLFLPGGTLHRGERVLAGAARELREEIGVTAHLVELGRVQVRPTASWVTFYALADLDDETAGQARPASAEIASVNWVRPDALPDVDAAVRAALEHVRTSTAAFDGLVVSPAYQPAAVAQPGRNRSG